MRGRGRQAIVSATLVARTIVDPMANELRGRPCLVGVMTTRSVQHYFPCRSLAEASVIARQAAAVWPGRVWIEDARGSASGREIV